VQSHLIFKHSNKLSSDSSLAFILTNVYSSRSGSVFDSLLVQFFAPSVDGTKDDSDHQLLVGVCSESLFFRWLSSKVAKELFFFFSGLRGSCDLFICESILSILTGLE